MITSNGLIQLYDELYQHTKESCGKCRAPYSCCSIEYCSMALDIAKDNGIDLSDEYDEKVDIPFLKDNQCVVLPYLRPLCTKHTCKINALGYDMGESDEWNNSYFELIDKINETEYETNRFI